MNSLVYLLSGGVVKETHLRGADSLLADTTKGRNFKRAGGTEPVGERNCKTVPSWSNQGRSLEKVALELGLRTEKTVFHFIKKKKKID